jgi:autotransporter-associated beta strand protein
MNILKPIARTRVVFNFLRRHQHSKPSSAKLMRKTKLPIALALAAGLFCGEVRAANLFFDINGTTAGSGTANGGSYSWEGSFWATGSGGTLATSAWTEGNFPEFSAGTDNTTGSYTVTAGSPHTIVGTLQRTSSGTVTLAGAALTIDTTGGVTPAQVAGGPQQGFFSSGITKFTAKLTGNGGISAQSGQLALDNSANDYKGGTTLNGGLVNFNGATFGTSNIFVRANGGALIAEATGLTVPNNITIIGGSAVNLSATANNFASTYTGTWDLGGFTEAIGVGGGTGCSATLTGIISNGGLGRQVASTHGTLFLAAPNTYAGKTTIDSSITKVTSLNSVVGGSASSSLGHPITVPNGTIGFGAGSTNGTLLYAGTGETTDRVIDLQAPSGSGIIDQSGTGLLKFTSAMTATGLGSKALTLQGSTAGTGEFAGVISDNATTGTTASVGTTASGATTMTLGSVDGVTVGASISATGIPAAATVTAINTGTKVVTLSAATTASIANGSTITVAGVKNLTGVTKSGTGAWTLSGVNTYHGNTILNTAGTLNLANASALGFSTFVINQNGLFDNVSGADLTITNAMTMSGGSPTYVGTANNMTITGPVSIGGANRNITVTAKTLTLTQGITQDASSRGFTKNGNGTLVLSGTSAYTGSTTINAGELQVDGSLASSSGVTIAVAGILGGNGVVPAVTVNGTISPGASPGSLTTGAETWAGGGSYVWEINDFSGTAGNNYDVIQAASLNIASTTGTKFNIKVTSLNGTAAGQAANFDGNTDYDFTILHTTGGITGNGVAAITVDASAFQNSLGNGGFFFVSISNDGNDLILSYRRAAFITSSPTSATLSAGQTANFSGSATSSGTVTYQWRKGGVNLSNGAQSGGSVVTGATTANLTVAGVTYQDEGAYTLVATGTYGPSATTTAATLSVVDPPVITSPTVDSTINKDAGQNVVLSVTSTGRVGTYQWKKGASNLSNGAYDNGATVTGATSANLTLTSVRGADASVYSVTLITSEGNVTSANTTLTVNDPVIAVQPVCSTFDCGSSNALTVTAIGTTNANGSLTYQWFTPDANGTAITDATNATLPFPIVSFANAGSYMVVVSNAFGNFVTSSVATVTVQDTNAPVVAIVGSDVTVECHGSYVDAGASATDSCDGSVLVTTTGSVDANTVGQYTLTYSATDSHSNIGVATRVVTVSDTTAPALGLAGLPELTITCGAPYSDAGATASDVCAGDITGAIVVNYGGLNPAAPVAGDYTITYNVQDPSHNAATAVTRLVHVVDSVPPVITITGANPATVECHGSYTEAGATATDNCATGLTPVASGSVDANTLGQYTVTYTVSDGANTATATRIVNVVDTTGPNVVLNGASAVTVECHTSYTDAGATATDACEGSTSVTVSGALDVNTVGVYTQTYSSTDAHGNVGSTTRQITVHDSTAPVITVNDGVSTVECHGSYTDAGATVSDTCDLAPSLNSSGSVDANTTGFYTITYSATDASGNHATATRVVEVRDTTKPTIILTGAAAMTIECHSVFTEPGYSVNDTCDQTVAVVPAGAVDANTPGVYTLTYTATDASLNSAVEYRTVTVSDTQPPVLSMIGSAMTVECHGGFTDPGATANDACEGPVSVTTNNPVNVNVVGDYTITYTACDSSNHCTSVTRVVSVHDSVSPSVALIGTNNMIIECHGGFTDPGATVTDACDTAVTLSTNGTVNADVLGAYTLTYSSTDADGNAHSITRVVTVVDSAPPSITVTGGDQTIECHGGFTDAGATATDLCQGDVTSSIGVTGNVNADTLGIYTLTYTVTDASSNNATAYRVVTVHDTVPPVVTLLGDTNTTIECHGTYTEAGATAADTCDTTVTTASTPDTVDTQTPGVYNLTYTATDAAGNVGTSVRTVTVSDTQPPVLSVIGSSVDVECHTSFNDPGATATDACEGAVAVITNSPVNVDVLGDYTVTYTACDLGNHCSSDYRVVHVVDHTPPVVSVTGDNPANTCQGSEYVDAGATASDTCNGSISASLVGGSVDTNTFGSYTLTYTATDASGNIGTAYRIVNVVDCGITITQQPLDNLKQPEGTNVELRVYATTPFGTLSYQWYEAGVQLNNETNSNVKFAAHKVPTAPNPTNVIYNVVITGTNNHTATSGGAHVTVILDKQPPGISLTSPKNNARSDKFTIAGTATDTKGGNVKKIVYQYQNANGAGTGLMVTNDLPDVGTPLSRTFSFPDITLPPGTNTLTVWSLDMSGKLASAPKVVKGLFSRVTETFTLDIQGDGNGTVTATTKGAPGESVTAPIVGGASHQHVELALNKYQLYTFTFTPDTGSKVPVQSVVSNAPVSTVGVTTAVNGNTAGTDSTKKLNYNFRFDGAESHTVYFNRNRRVDMAGKYNGVYSETLNPSIGSSGLLQNMTVQSSGTFSAKVLSAGVTSQTITGTVKADGTATGVSKDNKYVVSGYLAWSDQATQNGVKQFIGTVQNPVDNWTADVTADRAETSGLTAGNKMTMVIPSVEGGPTGSSFATILDTASTRMITFTLADNAKATPVLVPVSASGNMPIYAYPKYGTGEKNTALFGTMNTHDANVTLNWVKLGGGTHNPVGFTNAPVATVSPVTTGLTGQHTISIVGGTFNLNYTTMFNGLGKTNTPIADVNNSPNILKISQDSSGKLTVVFGTGVAKATLKGYAGTLENAGTGGGFFFPTATSTDSGVITIH